MKKWIIWAIVLLVLAGAGVGTYMLFFRKKEDDTTTTPEKPTAPDIPNTPDAGLNPNAILSPATPTPATPAPTPEAALVSVKSAQGRAAIATQAELLENNSRLVNAIRARYEIGARLFDGLRPEAAEAIKISFEENIKGLDKNNFMEYPIFGTYTKPQLLQELQTFITANANGYSISSSKKFSADTPQTGYIPSVGYNFATGGDRAGLPNYDFFMRSNSVANAGIAGLEVVKFAKNWISEIERLNKMVELEAVNICIRNGWRFAEYSAPTTSELS